MLVVLRTLCGATREVEVGSLPRSQDIVVPILVDNTGHVDDLRYFVSIAHSMAKEAARYGRRRFSYSHDEHDRRVYLEVYEGRTSEVPVDDSEARFSLIEIDEG